MGFCYFGERRDFWSLRRERWWFPGEFCRESERERVRAAMLCCVMWGVWFFEGRETYIIRWTPRTILPLNFVGNYGSVTVSLCDLFFCFLFFLFNRLFLWWGWDFEGQLWLLLSNFLFRYPFFSCFSSPSLLLLTNIKTLPYHWNLIVCLPLPLLIYHHSAILHLLVGLVYEQYCFIVR